MAILTVAILLALLIALQFALPPLAERQIENRLTKGGGSARVELKAIPSVRLLFKEGDSLKVRATGLITQPADPSGEGGLDDLDGFSKVDIQAIGLHVGPLTIARLTLKRDGADEPYHAQVQATVTGAALSAYAGGQIGGGIGGFLGGLAGSAMPGATVPIPIDLEGTLISDDGTIRPQTVNGTVAGLPAGPFVAALTAALAGRL